MDLGAIWADLRWNWKARLKRLRLHLIAFAAFVVGGLELVDPWSIMSFVPDRWQGLGYLIFGGLVWLLRKIANQPVLVTTTAYGEEQVVTEPITEPDHDSMDDDGAPPRPIHRSAEDFGHSGPTDYVI
jgi:hypothetical protein